MTVPTTNTPPTVHLLCGLNGAGKTTHARRLTEERRATWRDLARDAGYNVVLHYVQVPVKVAIARAETRAAANTAGAHRLDADAIRHLAALFEEPSEDEGLPIVLVQ